MSSNSGTRHRAVCGCLFVTNTIAMKNYCCLTRNNSAFRNAWPTTSVPEIETLCLQKHFLCILRTLSASIVEVYVRLLYLSPLCGKILQSRELFTVQDVVRSSTIVVVNTVLPAAGEFTHESQPFIFYLWIGNCTGSPTYERLLQFVQIGRDILSTKWPITIMCSAYVHVVMFSSKYLCQ